MDNPHLCKTTSTYNSSIMDGFRNVKMLPEQLMNWCMSSLERANENLRTLLTSKPVKAPCKDTATLTEPLPFLSAPSPSPKATKYVSPRSKAERKVIDVTISKKSVADGKAPAFALPTYANYLKSARSPQAPNSKDDEKLFAKYLDELRRILFVDDDHMMCRELLEENSLRNFYKRIDKWELENSARTLISRFTTQSKPKPYAQNLSRSNDICWNRQFGGGIYGKYCRCGGSCQRNTRINSRTYYEYDWTNYDWCESLKVELRRRTKQLDRLKRELKLRAIRLLPSVNCH